MPAMTPHVMSRRELQISRWEARRQQGKHAFILRHGVFGFGLVLGLTTIGRALAEADPQPAFDELLGKGIFHMLVSGSLFGWAMWCSNEAAWLKHLQRRGTGT